MTDLQAIAEAINRLGTAVEGLAHAVHRLGNADAQTSMGGLEALGLEMGKGLTRVAEAIQDHPSDEIFIRQVDAEG